MREGEVTSAPSQGGDAEQPPGGEMAVTGNFSSGDFAVRSDGSQNLETDGATPATARSAASEHSAEFLKARQIYARTSLTRLAFCALFLLLACVCFIADLMSGPAQLSAQQVLSALFGDASASVSNIVRSIRLPMALMALAVGAALGLSGALMQTILNNPLASPYTLGVSAAAGFGASLIIAFGAPVAFFSIPLGAFAASALSSLVLFIFARNFSSATLVLVGIAMLFLFQALLSLVQFLVSPEVEHQILFWLFGSLAKAQLSSVAIVAALCAGAYLWLLRDNWALSAFKMGEKNAAVLGVNLRRLRLKVLFCVCLISSVAISFVGVIGFIGLAAPHIGRILLGEDQRYFLPASMLLGAALCSCASVISKLITPGGLFPIGIVTSFIGVPFFFYIVIRNKRA